MTNDSKAAQTWKSKSLKTQNVAGVAGCSGSVLSVFLYRNPNDFNSLEGICSGVAGVAAFFSIQTGCN
jgi:hypothetical protein